MDSFLFYLVFKVKKQRKLLDRIVRIVYINNIKLDNISGDDNEEDTPVPIPNTAVKLFDAKDT